MSASAFPEKLRISSASPGLPSKVIAYGNAGIGKTPFASFAPKPVFLMTRGENGLLTLMDNGIIKPTDHFPEIDDWLSLLQALDLLLIENTGHKTFVMDVLNGAQLLCFEHVIETSFGGNPEKFAAYGKGPEVAVKEWVKLIGLLHKLNTQKKMSIILLAHAIVKPFKNPEGDDYDRYRADMHEKTWGLVERWADIVLFMNFLTFTKKDGGDKAKGFGKDDRFMYTRRTAAYDAKNRLDLPQQIPMGKSAQEAWSNFATLVRAAKQTYGHPPQAPAVPTNGATEPPASETVNGAETSPAESPAR